MFRERSTSQCTTSYLWTVSWCHTLTGYINTCIAPAFHYVTDTSRNGEIYNLMIRGADIGGSDGINIWGSNIWVHDVSVTNRDECVCTKSPASNFLVERVWCNQSGGSSIGSLTTGTTVADITYRNIYTNGVNQMFMSSSNTPFIF